MVRPETASYFVTSANNPGRSCADSSCVVVSTAVSPSQMH